MPPTASIALTFDWIPEPAVMAGRLESIGYNIRSFREPLTRSVREVLAPSLQENFDVGGRPPWEPLAPETINLKGDETILVRSGLLRRVAGQLNIWDIDRETASLGTLPRAEYGMIHQFGSAAANIPQRAWAVIQEDDVDRIEEIFAEWLEERIERAL